MLFDPGAWRAAPPSRLGAAAALAALLVFAGIAGATAQENPEGSIPAASQPGISPPPPVKKRHHKRKPPEAEAPVPLGPADAAALIAPPPPAAPAPAAVPPEPPDAAALIAPSPPAPPPPPSPAEPAPAATTGPETDAALLDHLCAQNLRHNEEDRIYGLISLTVRDTLSYDGIRFTADLIDDAVQESLDGVMRDCPRIIATDPAHRLGLVIEDIQNTTLQRVEDRKHPVRRAAVRPLTKADAAEQSEERQLRRRVSRPLGKATAADLSQELTSWEIDSWLDGLPPLQRALALFQYASDVTPKEVAGALGIPAATLKKDAAAARINLLSFFRERDDGNPDLPSAGPPIQYRIAGISIAGLLAPEPPPGHPQPTLRITGISSDLYAGWSLLATSVGMPADESLDLAGPIMVATDGKEERRMIVVGVAEISKPDDPVRRFLLKAYTIDGDSGGAGFHDTLHLVAGGVDNTEALRTLHNGNLSNIEIARCLWHDYGAEPDPGLCR